MTHEQISLKLKTFAHSEFSEKKFSDTNIIKSKIEKKVDLFERGHKYEVVELNKNFPDYILRNIKKYHDFIV